MKISVEVIQNGQKIDVLYPYTLQHVAINQCHTHTRNVSPIAVSTHLSLFSATAVILDNSFPLCRRLTPLGISGHGEPTRATSSGQTGHQPIMHRQLSFFVSILPLVTLPLSVLFCSFPSFSRGGSLVVPPFLGMA